MVETDDDKEKYKFREQLAKLSWATKTDPKRPKSAGYAGSKRANSRPAPTPSCNVSGFASTPALSQGHSFEADLVPHEAEKRSASRPTTASCRRLHYSEATAAAPCAPAAPGPADDLENLPRLLRASGTRPEWLQSFQQELMDTFRQELRAVNKAVAEIRHECKASVSVTSSNMATGFAQVSASLSQTLMQTQQKRPEVEHPKIIEEVPNPPKISDVSTILAGFQKEMDRKPLGHRPQSASAVPTAGREDRGEDKLARILQELERLRAQMDLSPVLQAIREQRPQADASRVAEHGRKGRAEPDFSGLLEEVRKVRKEVDFSPVIEEVRGMRQELADRTSNAGKADTPVVLQELRRMVGELNQLRRPSLLPESAHGGHKLQAVVQRVISDARSKASEGLEATCQENGKRAKPPFASESEEDANAGQAATDAEETREGLLERDNEALKSDIFALRWELQRLEVLMDKKMADYNQFLSGLVQSSAKPTLSDAYDLSKAEILGKGHYGFVLRCINRGTGRQVVAKVLSERWGRVVVGEWAHGSDVAEHPNIVQHLGVLMHRDKDGEMGQRIKAAFDAGALQGKCPARFPDSYFCLMLEFMDRGSAQQLVDKGHLTLEGLAAIVRQVASALAFLHKRKRTHNDVKPENILLKHSSEDGCLLVKLADMGLAEHSTDRTRDHDLLAYSIWCMALGRSFGQCPSGQRREDAVDELRSLAAEQQDGGLANGLAKLVQGLWRANLGMAEVEAAKELKGHKVHIHTNQQNSLGTDMELPLGRGSLKHARTIR